MSTNKYLKHLKCIDRFLIAYVSKYFEKHSGRDSSSYIQQTDAADLGPVNGPKRNHFGSGKCS